MYQTIFIFLIRQHNKAYSGFIVFFGVLAKIIFATAVIFSLFQNSNIFYFFSLIYYRNNIFHLRHTTKTTIKHRFYRQKGPKATGEFVTQENKARIRIYSILKAPEGKTT